MGVSFLLVSFLLYNKYPNSLIFSALYYIFMLFIALVLLSDIVYRSISQEYLHDMRTNKFLKSFTSLESIIPLTWIVFLVPQTLMASLACTVTHDSALFRYVRMSGK